MFVIMKRLLASLLWSVTFVLALVLLATPDHIAAADSFEVRLSVVASAQRFDLVNWIIGAFAAKVQDKVLRPADGLSESQRSALIERYFTLARAEEELRAQIIQRRAQSAPSTDLASLEAQRAAKRAEKLTIERSAETVIAERVERAAQAEGLAQDLPFNPQLIVPPVEFKYVTPPLLLVMSPHDTIEQKRTVHLLADMTISEIEATEAAADQLGFVSLIVPIGGVGTYPTMVLENSSYDISLEIVSHEWTHNYLDVRPLGMHYSDRGNNGAMTSVNETTANIVGHELANRVRGLPPPTYENEPEPPPRRTQPNQPPEFDFNQEMRITRLYVDVLLKEGNIAEAETYMETRRQLFVAHGYALRKLNQAYFAFYGSYADGGVGTVNPIGGELKRLRKTSGSLKAYLDAISQISSFEEYRALLKAKGVAEG
ncbi:MAG: hypothetical protein ABI874_05985, partial [Chloroflexota bacterium]